MGARRLNRLQVGFALLAAAAVAAGLAGCGGSGKTVTVTTTSTAPASSTPSGKGESAANVAELGISVRQAVTIADVGSNSPVAREGLQSGDVIVALGGTPISSIDDLKAALRRHEPGQRVTITIVRDGKKTSRAVTLAAG